MAKALSITPLELEGPSVTLISPPCSVLQANAVRKFHRMAMASQVRLYDVILVVM